MNPNTNTNTNNSKLSRQLPFTEGELSGPIYRSNQDGHIDTLFELFERSCLLYASRPFLGRRKKARKAKAEAKAEAKDAVKDEATILASPQPWQWDDQFTFNTYSQVHTRVCQVSAALCTLSLLPAPPTLTSKSTSTNLRCLGILMGNCPAWLVMEHAVYRLAGTLVPLYESLTDADLAFIVNQTKLTTVAVRSVIQARRIIDQVVPQCPTIRTIILCLESDEVFLEDELDALELSKPEELKHQLRSAVAVTLLSDLEDYGRSLQKINHGGEGQSLRLVHPPHADDIATVCYTSGTTGRPKGALLKHRNILAVCAAGMQELGINAEDRYLSFLPLPHIFERVIVSGLTGSGSAIGFFRGDITLLVDDLKLLQPSVFCAVPRLLTRLHDKVKSQADAGATLSAKLLRSALHNKLANLHAGRKRGRLVVSHGFYDRTVLSAVRRALGLHRVRLLVSGGAPLPAATLDFFRILMGAQCECLEGYGQTETAGCTTIAPKMSALAAYMQKYSNTEYSVTTSGAVGCPIAACEVRLVNVPSMGYLSSDRLHADRPCLGRGEIWVRGACVFAGYLDNPEATDEMITSDGWLKSGDIGLWTPCGQLVIIDRLKSLMKLAQGEYVAPEKIEAVLSSCPLVSQVFVHGDSGETALVAVVVPDLDEVVALFRSQQSLSVPAVASANICKWIAADQYRTTTLHEALLTQMKDISTAARLLGYETVRAVHIELSAAPWSPQDGMLTPTLKLKRPVLRQRYKVEIAAMYETLRRNPQLRSKL